MLQSLVGIAILFLTFTSGWACVNAERPHERGEAHLKYVDMNESNSASETNPDEESQAQTGSSVTSVP